ncbi:unnamed protein product [Brachionus calyciflorus]|uniref:Uncharacterized protein n=1 Tax=Brachionus calyciflorus TaxID=104777 RepID=A0A814S7M4_9BILA|nr:unnamed protein product [Brachionus calyciflorus]
MSDLNLNFNDQILSLSISHDLKNLLISLFVNLNDLNGRFLTNENKIKELNSTVFNDHTKRTITQTAKSIYDHGVNILKLSKGFNFKASILNIEHNEDHRKPALIQIQNYLKHRRQKHGEVNSIDGLLEYVQPKLFSNIDIIEYAVDLPFYFGAEINEGNDDSHFHLGITSKQLNK